MAKKIRRQSNGLYRKSVWTGEVRDGRRIYKQISAYTLDELNNKVEEYERVMSGEVKPEKAGPTFYDYSDEWHKVHKATTSDNTRRMYREIIATYFKEATFLIAEMTPMDVMMLINSQAGHTATQQKMVLVVKQVVKQAMRDDVIPVKRGQNVLDSVPKIRHQAKEKRALTDNEVLAIKTAAYRYPTDEAFILLIYGCGLRREEALALTSYDFEWGKGTVRIDKALAFINNTSVLKQPKTVKSNRILPIPQSIRERLEKSLSERQGPIFATNQGRLFTHSAYTKMWTRIKDALRETGYPIGDDLTAHLFRHNYVTQLCYQVPRISLKKVSQLTGDREDTILKIYNHVIAERENVGDALDVF